MDLLDFFRGERPWGQLYRLVDNLPAWGHYKSQLVMDEEWAKWIVDQEEANKEHPPADVLLSTDLMSPEGYTPEVGRLDLILDRIQSLESAVVWTTNPKEQRPSIAPMPRPETAVDRERERRTRSLLNEVDALFMSEGLTIVT